MTPEPPRNSWRDLPWTFSAIQFVVIVTAVIAGLQVHDWIEEREDRTRAARLSGDLINDLIVEGTLMERTITYFEVVSDYAVAADADFARPSPADDEAFLIALYNATQVTTPQRIGADYQMLAAREFSHLIDPDLSRLMLRHYSSKNLPLLSRVVVDSEYRALLRRRMPSDLQRLIADECGDIRAEEGYVVALKTACEIDFSGFDTAAIAETLHSNEELRDALAHMRGNLEPFIENNRADLIYLRQQLDTLQP